MMNKKNRAVGGAPIVESRKKSLGIYVHIPFCRSKCEYCDFYSIPGARSKELMTRYLDAVIAHIRESAPCAVGYEQNRKEKKKDLTDELIAKIIEAAKEYTDK